MKAYKPFIDYLEKSEKARNEEELFGILQETMLPYGYDLVTLSVLVET